jgi:hypothetical protein
MSRVTAKTKTKKAALANDPKTTDESLVTELSKTHYLATDDQVKALASRYLNGLQAQDVVRGCYFKVFCAAAIRDAKAYVVKGQPTANEILGLVDKVHESYYALVLEAVVTPDIADAPNISQTERTTRSLERNRRTNFARTAKYAVAGYVKAGGDLFKLDPDTVTKSDLVNFVTSMASREEEREETDPKTLQARVETAVTKMEEMCRELADEDKERATHIVQDLLTRMSAFISELGLETTSRSGVAAKEMRMLKIGGALFFPLGKAAAAQH